MKKLVLSVSALLMLALGIWIFWPEYGAGYSEEQRRLWNERRNLLPPVCLLSYNPDGLVLLDIQIIQLLASKSIESVEEEVVVIKQRDKDIQEKQIQLRDREAPDCDFTARRIVKSTEYPLEGLSSTKLDMLSHQGNATVPLLSLLRTVIRDKSCTNIERSLASSSWQVCQQAKHFLAQAAQNGSVTAPFLLRYIEDMQTAATGYDRQAFYQGRGMGPKIPQVSITSIKGFNDFQHLLLQGDSTGYAVLEYVAPREAYDPIKEALYRKFLPRAQAGDAKAQNILASILLGRYQIYPLDPSDIYRDVLIQIGDLFENVPILDKLPDSISTFIFGKLPDSFPSHLTSYLSKLGFFTADSSIEWQQYCQASLFAYQAGCHGDLNGMYLWLRFGLHTKDFFTREEWENIFSFSRCLLDAGYTPFVEFIDQSNPRQRSLYHTIIQSYYSPESWNRLSAICRSLAEPSSRLSGIDQLKDNCNYNPEYAIFQLEKAFCKADEQTRFRIEAWCNDCIREGNLPALLVFSQIYARGAGVSKDPGRAYVLLKRALQDAPKYPAWTVCCDGGKQTNLLFKMNDGVIPPEQRFEDTIKLLLVQLVLDNPEFPGRNEQEAFQLAHSMFRKFKRNSLDYPYCYILGRVYEQGVGTKVDLIEALKYYKYASSSAFTHADSKERYEKLVQKTNDKQKQPLILHQGIDLTFQLQTIPFDLSTQATKTSL